MTAPMTSMRRRGPLVGLSARFALLAGGRAGPVSGVSLRRAGIPLFGDCKLVPFDEVLIFSEAQCPRDSIRELLCSSHSDK
jgi:hypothetical protein